MTKIDILSAHHNRESVERQHSLDSAFQDLPEQVISIIETFDSYERKIVIEALYSSLGKVYDEGFGNGMESAHARISDDNLRDVLDEIEQSNIDKVESTGGKDE
jgi:hypothetical protein